MKKLSFLVLLSLFIFSCSEDNLSLENVEQKQLVSLEDIQEAVEKELSQGKVFYWEDGDDHFVWSAGMHSDSVFSIGYTIGPSFNPETDMPSVDIN
ncbi:MAG: hypothetical protein P1V34_02955, partial [Alphaproteobacteria bacterium]|nr:hypothetical protein [Alphaproteobacteria bacterium]